MNANAMTMDHLRPSEARDTPVQEEYAGIPKQQLVAMLIYAVDHFGTGKAWTAKEAAATEQAVLKKGVRGGDPAAVEHHYKNLASLLNQRRSLVLPRTDSNIDLASSPMDEGDDVDTEAETDDELELDESERRTVITTPETDTMVVRNEQEEEEEEEEEEPEPEPTNTHAPRPAHLPAQQESADGGNDVTGFRAIG